MREAPVSSRDWAAEAADYARSVADNAERYGYKRVPGGGWEWTDLITNQSFMEEQSNDDT